jgi:alkylation response protein AidB-like acyl-CoA dehydrogenase
MTLVDVARDLAPMVASRAAEAEAARRLPADLARTLASAGLFRMTVPRDFGGGETDARTFFDVLETLGTADAATSWCTMIASTSALAAAWLPPHHAETMFSRPDGISGGVFAPLGRAVAEGDSFSVSGRWAWASGSANCDWLLGGAMIIENGEIRRLANGAPDHRMMFFEAKDVALIDTWEASGMRGTGSGDMAVENVRIPADRSVSFFTDRPRSQAPLYAFPPFGLLALGIAAVASGNALAALADVKELAGAKKAQGSSRTLAERGTVQAAFAEASAALDAARALAHAAIAAAWDEAQRTAEIGLEPRARLRMAATHLTRTAARVLDSCWDIAGGTAVYARHPLQRRWRDAHVATQHIMVAPATLELTGRVALGLPTDASAL